MWPPPSCSTPPPSVCRPGGTAWGSIYTESSHRAGNYGLATTAAFTSKNILTHYVNTQIYLRKIGIANGIIRNRQIGWHRFLKLAISFHSMIFVSATQLPICLPRVNTHLEECCKCESAVRHFQLGGEGPSRRGLFRDHENFVDLCFQL